MLKTQQPNDFDQSFLSNANRDGDVPACASEYEEIFVDPRCYQDRRQKDEPGKIPGTGCRRRGERRTMVYMKNEIWWMKRNYSNVK